MANFFDYLDWYGDFDFATIPFNEVDNLILSQLAYMQLDGALGPNDVMTVPELQEHFLAIHCKSHEDPEGVKDSGTNLARTSTATPSSDSTPCDGKLELPDNGPLIDKSTNLILERMAAAGRRFGEARVGYYEKLLDEETHEQFAAVTILLPDGSIYVAFRGTDDTVAGWIEDCELSYHIVPAQSDALNYLRRIARSTIGPLRVGGHSKGGNLAAYAAVAAPELDARIEDVWCNDSPGFVDDVVPLADFERLRSRMHLFTPEYGVVAALFEHPLEAQIVQSSGKGVMAHSLVSWQVMRDNIIRARELLPGAIAVNHTFNQLFGQLDFAGRKQLVVELAQALSDSNIHAIGDLMGWGNPRLRQLVASLDSLSDENRQTVQDLLVALTGGAIKGEVEESVAAASKALAPVAQAVSSALAEAERRASEMIASYTEAPVSALPSAPTNASTSTPADESAMAQPPQD